MIDDKNINEWLTRFFNGDTTCDEEKALFAYFRQTNIPSSVEQYREMMKWYDTGLQREYNEDEISLTFREGINMREIAKIIENNTNNSFLIL